MKAERYSREERKGIMLLFATSIIWGSGFIAIKYSLSELDPYRFM